jgi:hypothetical protein
LAISYLPQRAVAQKRGIALALVRKGDNLLREELSFAFGLRSPAGFSAACNSMLSERAPTPIICRRGGTPVATNFD